MYAAFQYRVREALNHLQRTHINLFLTEDSHDGEGRSLPSNAHVTHTTAFFLASSRETCKDATIAEPQTQ